MRDVHGACIKGSAKDAFDGDNDDASAIERGQRQRINDGKIYGNKGGKTEEICKPK